MVISLAFHVLYMQVEETTREREERLKGWSQFLEGGEGEQQKDSKPAESSTATEPSEPSSTTEPEQQPKSEPQSSEEQQEEEVDSTDSSLAGSEDEEA